MTPTVRCRCLTALLLCAVPLSAPASELLASWRLITGENLAAGTEPHFTAVRFSLAHSTNPPYLTLRLGYQTAPYWENGTSGTYDFTPASSNWAAFIEKITDGVNQHVASVGETLPVGFFGYNAVQERVAFGTSSDLIGTNVDYIHLIVHNVHIWIEGDWQYVQGDTEWQFWGTPEPGTFGIAAVGLIALRRRAGRPARSA